MRKKWSGQNPLVCLSAQQVCQLQSTLEADPPLDMSSASPVASPDQLWTQWQSFLESQLTWQRASALQAGILMAGMIFSSGVSVIRRERFFQQVTGKLLEKISTEWDADVLEVAASWYPELPVLRRQLWDVWRLHLAKTNSRLRQVAVMGILYLESRLRHDPDSLELCRELSEHLIQQLSVEQDALVLLAVRDWVPLSFSVEDSSGRGQWWRTLPAACLWTAWEFHLTSPDPSNRSTAFCAGVNLLGKLSDQPARDRLIRHITVRLLEQLERETHPSVIGEMREACLKWPLTDIQSITRLWAHMRHQLKVGDWRQRELAIRAALQWETGLRNLPEGEGLRKCILECILNHLAAGKVEYSWELIARWSPPDVEWAEIFWDAWESLMNNRWTTDLELPLTAAIVLVQTFAHCPAAERLVARVEFQLGKAINDRHDWNGWEILAGWCPTRPDMAVYVWENWKHHLMMADVPDWRKQGAAVRAGIHLESTLGNQFAPGTPLVDGLLSDIRETLLDVIARTEKPWLLLAATWWQPQHEPTLARLRQIWERHGQGKWDIQTIARRALARTENITAFSMLSPVVT